MASQILDPTGQEARAESRATLSPRPSELRGTIVSLLATGKQNSAEFVHDLGELLRAHYGVGEVHEHKKPVATVESPPELLSELAGEADLVVIAVGDCGSCSAAAIADGIALELLGTPTAVVCTESFRATADAMAALRGAMGYQYATVAHPVAGLGAEQLHERVDSVADEVVSLLVQPAAGRGAA